MYYFSFKFIQVQNVARPFWTLLVFYPRNFGNSSLFTAACKNSPCAPRRISADNRLCKRRYL